MFSKYILSLSRSRTSWFEVIPEQQNFLSPSPYSQHPFVFLHISEPLWLFQSPLYFPNLILTISYLARERSLWNLANSRLSWIVTNSFQIAKRTMPRNIMLLTTANMIIMTSGAVLHSKKKERNMIHYCWQGQCLQNRPHQNTIQNTSLLKYAWI